jgi:hypothetical protein
MWRLLVVLVLMGVAEAETRVDNEPAFDPCCMREDDASSVADDNDSVP